MATSAGDRRATRWGSRPRQSSEHVRAVVVLVVLAVLLALLLALSVPWSALGADAPAVRPDPSRDFTAAELARDTAFHADLRVWTYPRAAIALLVTLVLGLTRWGGRLVVAAGRPLGGSWPAQVVAGTLALVALPVVLTLPLGVAAERVLRTYGLSTQDWSGWAVDVLRGTLVTAGVTALVLLVIVGLARRRPRSWWRPAALLGALLVVAGSTLYPVLVEPLANDFTPLSAGQLRTDLLDLADRSGIPVADVLVADASRRTTAQNAYVSGLGATRRLVVYDTLVDSATSREVELVVAHELGHARSHDVRVGTTLGAVGAALAAVALFLLLDGPWRRPVEPRVEQHGAASRAADPRVLALLLALVAAGSYVTAPVSTLVSRRIEARADVTALELTRDPVVFTDVQRRLALTNVSDLQPRWYRTVLFASHPAAPWRIALARAWVQQQGPDRVPPAGP